MTNKIVMRKTEEQIGKKKTRTKHQKTVMKTEMSMSKV